jgi:hypothetical protein
MGVTMPPTPSPPRLTRIVALTPSTALLVALVLVLALVAVGIFGVYNGTMRMVSTNSRAISAACHVLQEDQDYGYLMPMQWGVVEVKGGVGKVAFTTAPSHWIESPKEGKLCR